MNQSRGFHRCCFLGFFLVVVFLCFFYTGLNFPQGKCPLYSTCKIYCHKYQKTENETLVAHRKLAIPDRCRPLAGYWCWSSTPSRPVRMRHSPRPSWGNKRCRLETDQPSPQGQARRLLNRGQDESPEVNRGQIQPHPIIVVIKFA